IGLQRLEIAADGDRLGDHGAVVEDERRPPLHRIDRRIGVAALRQLPEIDLFGGDRDALLGQEDAHAARVGGAAAIVEFHRKHPPYPFEAARLSRPARRRQPALARPPLPASAQAPTIAFFALELNDFKPRLKEFGPLLSRFTASPAAPQPGRQCPIRSAKRTSLRRPPPRPRRSGAWRRSTCARRAIG